MINIDPIPVMSVKLHKGPITDFNRTHSSPYYLYHITVIINLPRNVKYQIKPYTLSPKLWYIPLTKYSCAYTKELLQ